MGGYGKTNGGRDSPEHQVTTYKCNVLSFFHNICQLADLSCDGNLQGAMYCCMLARVDYKIL